jgi:hypothetical protein
MGKVKLVAICAALIVALYVTLEPSRVDRLHLVCKGSTKAVLGGGQKLMNSTLGYVRIRQSPNLDFFNLSETTVSFDFIHMNEIGNTLVKMDDVKSSTSGQLHSIQGDENKYLFINEITQTVDFAWDEYRFKGDCQKVF